MGSIFLNVWKCKTITCFLHLQCHSFQEVVLWSLTSFLRGKGRVGINYIFVWFLSFHSLLRAQFTSFTQSSATIPSANLPARPTYELWSQLAIQPIKYSTNQLANQSHTAQVPLAVMPVINASCTPWAQWLLFLLPRISRFCDCTCFSTSIFCVWSSSISFSNSEIVWTTAMTVTGEEKTAIMIYVRQREYYYSIMFLCKVPSLQFPN